VSRALAGFGGLCLVVFIAVWTWARLPSFTPTTTTERAEVLRILRDALDGKGVPDRTTLDTPLADKLLVALYHEGDPVLRVEGRGATLGAATLAAARALADGVGGVRDEVRRSGRLKVDVLRARAPIITTIQPLFILSLVPGVDGIGLGFGDREVLFTADDLMRADVLAAHQPARAMDFDIGLDLDVLVRRLATAAGASSAEWRTTPKRWFRFRADGFIEPASHEGPPLVVTRGNTTHRQPVTREALLAGAVAGGQYLLHHLDADGRFGYEYYTFQDQHLPPGAGYSLPRHAGATYYLAQLYGATHDPAILDGARRAAAFLQKLGAGGPCDRPDRACVGAPDDRFVDLGSAAMSLLALAEYQRNTGDAQFEAWGKRLASFLVYMQKPDGEFCHLYEPGIDKRDEQTKMLYYSGEAAFALAKFTLLPSEAHEQRYLDAMDRGLDYLTGAAYDNLAGQFYFGEDHWTCLAADSAWDRLSDEHRRRYSKFCDGFAEFLRRMQFHAGESISGEQPDFIGSYGFSPFLPPHGTPVGSRSESAISCYLMDRRKGAPVEATRQQVLLGMQFLLAHQLTDDNAYLMRNPEAARGGLLMSDVKRYVRIDFIQHSCSAMLRAMELL
jgi:hypothetical protein